MFWCLFHFSHAEQQEVQLKQSREIKPRISTENIQMKATFQNESSGTDSQHTLLPPLSANLQEDPPLPVQPSSQRSENRSCTESSKLSHEHEPLTQEDELVSFQSLVMSPKPLVGGSALIISSLKWLRFPSYAAEFER